MEKIKWLIWPDKEVKIKIKKTVKEAMIKPIFLYPEDKSDKIIRKLEQEETHTCIVVDKDKKFIGEISVEDLIKYFFTQTKNEPLTKLLNMGYKTKIQHKTAKELVNKHKSTLKETDPINKAVKMIRKEGFNYIPVLNKEKKVLGVITPSSLINFLKNE